jgi:DNA-binding MarR family transcriptional regulator
MHPFPSSSVDDLPCACSALRRTARALTLAYDEALRPTGLRIGQFSILRRLRAVGEITVAELADLLALDRTTLARNLKPLERDALVGVRVGSDRRERLLALTPQGAAALDGAVPLWLEANARFNAQYGETRTARLHKELAAAAAVGGEMGQQQQ